MIRIGLDFDNTIVCYDKLFCQLAEAKRLIPSGSEWTKKQVRDYLRRQALEHSWVELQGNAYGASIDGATPFSGVREFLTRCTDEQVLPFVVSHKTRYPVAGPKVDLHSAADHWLESQGFYGDERIPRENVFFELTKNDKLARISDLRCDYFVDDLPEFLLERSFPGEVRRILFDPGYDHSAHTAFTRIHSWRELEDIVLAAPKGSV